MDDISARRNDWGNSGCFYDTVEYDIFKLIVIQLYLKMVKIQKINSIALTVADIDKATNFYTQALGFKTVGDLTFEASSSYSQLDSIPPTRIRLVTLQLGDELIELVQYLDLEAKPIPEDSQSNDLWFQHMAIVVSDINRAYKHLQSFPIQPISKKPQTMPADNELAAGVKAFKFRDPEGHSLEIIWFPKDKGKDKWQQNSDDLFLGIDHSAISVDNTKDSLKFYRDLLGMTVEGSNLNSGKIQADLDGLLAPEVKVTPLQPVEASIGVELLDYIKPGTGRQVPNDWKISDLAHMHFILEVDNIEQILDPLKQQGVKVISPNLIQFPESYRYRQGCLIKDPNGHALLLVALP